MNEDQLTLLLIKGAIAELPADEQQQVHAVTQQIRDVMAAYPSGSAAMAIALLGAELAALDV
ncbi:hypothetical protein [Jeongeupia chitinilytica]|uniref:Uncharacterized protein n=1 Tax=Jeongeupia chitinilytica TaxID=1041641 RepID=A0ABQ3H087_9NEIS|nr:hypothetical protein [Jeongeupia chitinilytica]GHD63819.1 hypothetical protein GCM10007350_22040 [Jeongeupia chitinilytica]